MKIKKNYFDMEAVFSDNEGSNINCDSDTIGSKNETISCCVNVKGWNEQYFTINIDSKETIIESVWKAMKAAADTVDVSKNAGGLNHYVDGGWE